MQLKNQATLKKLNAKIGLLIWSAVIERYYFPGLKGLALAGISGIFFWRWKSAPATVSNHN